MERAAPRGATWSSAGTERLAGGDRLRARARAARPRGRRRVRRESPREDVARARAPRGRRGGCLRRRSARHERVFFVGTGSSGTGSSSRAFGGRFPRGVPRGDGRVHVLERRRGRAADEPRVEDRLLPGGPGFRAKRDPLRHRAIAPGVGPLSRVHRRRRANRRLPERGGRRNPRAARFTGAGEQRALARAGRQARLTGFFRKSAPPAAAAETYPRAAGVSVGAKRRGDVSMTFVFRAETRVFWGRRRGRRRAELQFLGEKRPPAAAEAPTEAPTGPSSEGAAAVAVRNFGPPESSAAPAAPSATATASEGDGGRVATHSGTSKAASMSRPRRDLESAQGHESRPELRTRVFRMSPPCGRSRKRGRLRVLPVGVRSKIDNRVPHTERSDIKATARF